MTTATRCGPSISPLADHGTYARSVGRPAQGVPGCNCPLCRNAKNRYGKRRRVLNSTGRTLRVPAQPVADHVRHLFATGSGWAHILKKSGCSGCTIHRLLNGQRSMKRTVADRLLAVRPEPQPYRRVPTLGSTRRLRALLAIGHRIRGAGSIQEVSGVDQTVLSALISGRMETMWGDTADRIAAAYEQLAGQPGGYERNRRRAELEGWPGPDYWDADDFDNPDFQPATGATLRYVELAENGLELERHGHTREQAAERLKVSKICLQQAIGRYRKAQEEQAAA